jgi:type I restriction enzyme S subunit
MRKGWSLKTIAATSKIVSGGTPKTKIEEYWGGDIAWITPADLGKLNTREVSLTRRTITAEGLQKSSAKLFPAYSVILSSRAPIGHLAINTIPMATNQGCRGIVSSENLDNTFLYYFLKSNIKLLNELGTGTTFKELSTKALGSVEIPIPPIQEQKQIVAILDKAFTAIDQAKANIKKNIVNAKELFQSKLNAIFSQKGAGWEEKTLIEVNKFIDYRGKTPQKTDSGIKLITAKNVRMGYLRNNPEEFIAVEAYDDWMTRGIPKKGDVLFTTEAPLANVTLLNTSEKIALAQRIITLCPNREILSGEYLTFCLQSKVIQDKILEKGTGATVTGIKSRLLKEIIIPIPPTKTQADIVNVMSQMKNHSDEVINNLEKKLESLEELKKSILQKAFAGELTQKEVVI